MTFAFDKINGFVRDYDGTKYLTLFFPEKYDAISDRIRYFIGLKVILHTLILLTMQNWKLFKMMIWL